jgi:hypothetical protein
MQLVKNNWELKDVAVKNKWRTNYVNMLFMDNCKAYQFYININAYRRKSQIDKQLEHLSRQAERQGLKLKQNDFAMIMSVYLKAVQYINTNDLMEEN